MCNQPAHKAWISALTLGLAVIGLSGCATSQEELMPTQPGTSMTAVWHRAMGSGASTQPGAPTSHLRQARQTLRRPLPHPPSPKNVRAAYTRNAANEIYSQFHRLPNPNLTLYIYPHLAGGAGEQVPVPGYTTIFPMYTRPHYAQPGERAIYRRTVDSEGRYERR